MSKICFDTGAGANFSVYEITLQKTITRILKKIGISDKGITWVIVKEEKLKKMDEQLKKKDNVSIIDALLPSSPLVKEKCRYGLCDPDTSTIWISTEAIQTASFPMESQLLKRQNRLVNVILDELAHIETGKDHGDREYDAKLESFKEKYYG